MQPESDNRHTRLLEVIAKAKRRSSDRLIIRTMRFAVWGMLAIMVLFVMYIIATLYIGAHDNRRIDELDERIQKLERGR